MLIIPSTFPIRYHSLNRGEVLSIAKVGGVPIKAIASAAFLPLPLSFHQQPHQPFLLNRQQATSLAQNGQRQVPPPGSCQLPHRRRQR